MAPEVFWFIFALVFGGLIALLHAFVTFKWANRFRTVEHTNDSTYVHDYLMVEKEDKTTKTTEWRSVYWQKKLVLADPPKGNAIALDKFGRKHAVGFKIGKDQFNYVKNEEKKGDWKIVGSGDRGVLLNQIARAEEEKRKNISASEVLQFASVSILGIAVIIGIIFAVDIMEAYKGVVDQTHGVIKTQAEVQRMQTIEQLALMEREGYDMSKFNIQLEQQMQKQTSGGVNG